MPSCAYVACEMVCFYKNISYYESLLPDQWLSRCLPYRACYLSQVSRNVWDIWIMLKLLQFVCSLCTRVPPCSPCSFCYSIAQRPDDLITFVITMKLYIESELKKSQGLSAGRRHFCVVILICFLCYDLTWRVLCSTAPVDAVGTLCI